MSRILLYKSWLETRLRFLCGLLLVAATISHTVLHAPTTLRLVHQQMPWAHMLFSQYLWLSIYNGSLLAGWVILAVILSCGGLRKEQSLGVAPFTLSLPVRRRNLLRVQSLVALAELVALGLVPALLIPSLSHLIGEPFSFEQALRYAALLIGGGVIFHGWRFLLTQLSGSESSTLTIALSSIGAFFVLVKRIHALDAFDIFDTMSGADFLDRHTFVLHGPLPWTTFAVTLSLLAGLVGLSMVLIERHDF